MRVIVGKMPGGRAQEVELPDGGTVFEAIKAAGYESDLNQGFEARLNNAPTELSSTVTENSIITLTEKIKGNGLTAIGVVPVGTGKPYEKFVVCTPTIIHDFINIPDVKDMILRLRTAISGKDIKCLVVDPEEPSVSEPVSIIIYEQTVICGDTSNVINEGNYVVFCSEDTAEAIFGKDPISAITYIEEYIPDGNKNPNSLGGAHIPDEMKELKVEETCDCCEEDCCCCEEDTCDCYEEEACDCCEEETGDCCCCNNDKFIEERITIADLVDMCDRLGIHMTFSIPGDIRRERC